MSRIRSVKPDFFIHEELQDLEVQHPGFYPMFVYQGLWLQCDSNGVFPWRPRQLKLYILPFIPFDMETTLDILSNAGYLIRYKADGKEYGHIPTFKIHQRLSGKEATEGEKYPVPPCEAFEKKESFTETKENQQDMNREATGKQQGSSGEATGKQWGSSGEIPDVQEMEMEMSKEEIKNTSYFSAELNKPSSTGNEEPAVIAIPLITKDSEFNVNASMVTEWQSAYPCVDVMQELRNIRQWNIANPKKQKTKAGIMRHINTWLSDKQNRGGNPVKKGSNGNSQVGFNTLVSTGDRKVDISLTNAMNWAAKNMGDALHETG